jgi:hypothetical protein
MRLTLTRGLDRIHLRAERWDADRFLGTEEHASPVHNVRGDVALLLDRLLKR